MSDNKKIQLCICFPNENDKRLILNYKADPNTNSRQIVSLTIGQTSDPHAPSNILGFNEFKELYTILNTIEETDPEFTMDKNNSVNSTEILRSVRSLNEFGYKNIDELNGKIKTLIETIHPIKTYTPVPANVTATANATANATVTDTASKTVTVPAPVTANENANGTDTTSAPASVNATATGISNTDTSVSVSVPASKTAVPASKTAVPASKTAAPVSVSVSAPAPDPNEKYLLKPGNKLLFNTDYDKINPADKFTEYIINGFDSNNGTVNIQDFNNNSKVLDIPYDKFISNIMFKDSSNTENKDKSLSIDQIEFEKQNNIETQDHFNQLKEKYGKNYILFDTKKINMAVGRNEYIDYEYYPIFINTKNELEYYNKKKNKDDKKDSYDIVIAKILPESESDKIDNFLNHLSPPVPPATTGGNINKRKNSKSKHTKKQRNNRRKQTRKITKYQI